MQFSSLAGKDSGLSSQSKAQSRFVDVLRIQDQILPVLFSISKLAHYRSPVSAEVKTPSRLEEKKHSPCLHSVRQ